MLSKTTKTRWQRNGNEGWPRRFGGLSLFLVLALALACGAGTAQAGDVYRYKDPFGVWRAMVVPKGYARAYKRAQIRAYLRAPDARGCAACERPPALKVAGLANAGDVDVPTDDARMARLEGHRGLLDYQGVISKAAVDSGVDGALLSAVIAVESGFRKDARSPKGALGLMQLMPGTAAALLLGTEDMNAALADPATNIRAGSRHLRRLIDQYPGRLDLALAAYNAGEGAVNKYDDVPPYAETRQYVHDVIVLYARYKADR